jgi:hypothetical protein
MNYAPGFDLEQAIIGKASMTDIYPWALRVDRMPSKGRIVVAAPASEGMALYAAFELGLPYLLDPYVPEGASYVLDIDRCLQLDHEWLTDHPEPSTQG